MKADRAKAEFRDGILTITLPKAEEAKERRIPVQAGQTQDTQQTAQGKSRQRAQPRDQSEQDQARVMHLKV